MSPVAKADKVKIRLRNGYQKSDALLTANAAPSELAVAWVANGSVVLEERWKVARKMGWQEIILDPPTDRPFDTVRLNVLGVHEGRTYADLCISDAEVWVLSETPYSAPVENAKHKALQAWVAERQATADYFASQPKTYPFAATSFAQDTSDIPVAEQPGVASRMAQLESERKQMAAIAPTWWRLENKDTLKPPDGLVFQAELLRWFAPERTYFEAEGPWRSTKKDVNEWHREHREANAHLAKRADGTVRAATYGIYDVYEERSLETYDRQYQLVLDESERLVTMYGTWSSEGDGCETNRTTMVWDVSRDSEARVNGITQLERSECFRPWDEESGTRVSYTRTVYSPAGS